VFLQEEYISRQARYIGTLERIAPKEYAEVLEETIRSRPIIAL